MAALLGRRKKKITSEAGKAVIVVAWGIGEKRERKTGGEGRKIQCLCVAARHNDLKEEYLRPVSYILLGENSNQAEKPYGLQPGDLDGDEDTPPVKEELQPVTRRQASLKLWLAGGFSANSACWRRRQAPVAAAGLQPLSQCLVSMTFQVNRRRQKMSMQK